jgi:hypothetical protein
MNEVMRCWYLRVNRSFIYTMKEFNVGYVKDTYNFK